MDSFSRRFSCHRSFFSVKMYPIEIDVGKKEKSTTSFQFCCHLTTPSTRPIDVRSPSRSKWNTSALSPCRFSARKTSIRSMNGSKIFVKIFIKRNSMEHRVDQMSGLSMLIMADVILLLPFPSPIRQTNRSRVVWSIPFRFGSSACEKNKAFHRTWNLKVFFVYVTRRFVNHCFSVQRVTK